MHLHRRAIPALIIGKNEDDIRLLSGGSLGLRHCRPNRRIKIDGRRQEASCCYKKQGEAVSLLTHVFSNRKQGLGAALHSGAFLHAGRAIASLFRLVAGPSLNIDRDFDFNWPSG